MVVVRLILTATNVMNESFETVACIRLVGCTHIHTHTHAHSEAGDWSHFAATKYVLVTYRITGAATKTFIPQNPLCDWIASAKYWNEIDRAQLRFGGSRETPNQCLVYSTMSRAFWNSRWSWSDSSASRFELYSHYPASTRAVHYCDLSLSFLTRMDEHTFIESFPCHSFLSSDCPTIARKLLSNVAATIRVQVIDCC